MRTDPLRSAALGTFAVGLVLALSIGANAAEILLKCDVGYFERPGAGHVLPQPPLSNLFVVFDEEKKEFSISNENLRDMYWFLQPQKLSVYVDKERIYTSYKSEAFYMSENQQTKYFNLLTISINRHDGSFSMNSSPFYETKVEGETRFLFAGNIKDDFEHAPRNFEALEKWTSRALGNCKRTGKAF